MRCAGALGFGGARDSLCAGVNCCASSTIRADVVMGIPGVRFEDCWDRRVEADFDGPPVVFISKPDLIAAKRAAGRPQDLPDADLLSRE
jgi:hypothetical protein